MGLGCCKTAQVKKHPSHNGHTLPKDDGNTHSDSDETRGMQGPVPEGTAVLLASEQAMREDMSDNAWWNCGRHLTQYALAQGTVVRSNAYSSFVQFLGPEPDGPRKDELALSSVRVVAKKPHNLPPLTEDWTADDLIVVRATVPNQFLALASEPLSDKFLKNDRAHARAPVDL